MSDVDILYQISQLKDTDYKNVLAVTGLIELLIEKNIISRSEFMNKIKELDKQAENLTSLYN